MIKLQNVSIKYIKDFYAIYNLNLSFFGNCLLIDKEYTASIVLRLLAKMDKFEGEIFYDDINIKDIKNKDLPFAYLPSNPVLLNKSIYKNLIYPLKIRKVKNAANVVENAIKKHLSFLKYKQLKIEDIGKNVNISNSAKLTENEFKFLKNLRAKKLNQSEKQIVALLRAVIRQPKYLLIDKLFSTLSSEYVDLATEILSEYKGNIIACENESHNFYKNFNVINFDI